ncbi:uncharacterized protein znf469 [Eucyclogobius newberryi]|uniref:uncharacterized protein znf469 n=1 Tax=Eucyclogobius newberryi TaxID=166745 RepID=UPI003B5CA278
MAGESQQKHAVKQLDAESTLRDERPALEHHKDKTTKEFSEHFSNSSTEARASQGLTADKVEKERDVTQQREAVIRPQQTGKIDFSSLQHRTKFASDRNWPSGKASPQSPSGKGRSREKGRRAGKSERGNPQQLYRLSITHPPRSNPTIGIAYPQQKVSPPKKLEPSRGPVSGSFRFHIPSLPEREAELQQDELSYSRCFQDSSQGPTSQNYTSQPPAHQQPPASMENNSGTAGNQLLLTDFQISGSNTWQTSDRTFSGANFGQKSTALTDNNKSNGFVSGPFQYGYHMLEESASDAFSCEQNAPSQDFTDSLSTAHVAHSFPFGSGPGQNVGPSSTQFNNEPPFVPAVGSSIQCPSMSEDSASSDSSGSSSQQSEQGKTGMPECKDAVGQTDASGSKRNCHPKDNQRTLLKGSVHYARSLIQGPGTQMHFPNKKFNTNPTINNMHRGSVNFDKNMNNKIVSSLSHSWEGNNKTYQSNDQNTQYNDMNDKFQFQNQPVHDQRSNSSKNSRMPWQQIRPNTAMHNQNRQISNQKLAYMVSPSDWQEENKSHKQGSLKNSNTFHNGRQEPIKHGTSAVSTFKVEMSHTQVCESKNKTVYFGLNQPLTTASSRNFNYPPLQVPPMGLMMVSPYESPLPSPVHNPASSSTCSSLSPTSTSPVNFSSEDSQMSKPAPPHPYYHQAKSSSDHLSPHQFHSDRALPYTADRNKDNMMSYLQNNVHTKSSMDVNKTYIDSFGVEHHQPPPPYSAHQLATSLATANLDQLDVLLTCKQCDQNFNNLASFLGHKQYCSQHAFAQNELKEISKIDKKFNTEPVKTVSACSNVSLPRCPSDLHLSLLGLNKNGELIPDSEAKGENKDDSMKLNLFTGSGNLPVPLPELELEDAKLDSLITEALNGMGYQSDNAEIDSSFIDAFGDDELNNVKTTSTKQSLKTKECEKKDKPKEESDRSFTQGKYFYDSDEESPASQIQYTECKVEKISLNLEQDEKINIKKEDSHKNSRGASREKAREQDGKAKETRKLCKSEDKNTPRVVLSSKFSERCEVKGFQENGSVPSSQASLSPTSKTSVKESKRKNTAGGSWSKELIHKIVQQKNKLHKLHVKGTKNLQFSLVMERLTPTVKNPAFGEYDYVSDSDDECEPVKIASQGRLNQSSRCKYTYTKECKWRARSDRDQAAWRHESKECFEVKKSEELALSPEKPKLKRRSSRSSTSSDLSTSVSDSTSSPKSTDRTDSDCEKKIDVKRKEPHEQRTYERSSPYKLCKDSSKLALTFTKAVKQYNSEKAILSEQKEAAESPKKCQSQVSDTSKAADATKSVEKRKSSPSKTKEKPVFPSKESQSGVDKNSQSERVSVCAAQEDKQCNKPLHSDTHSPSVHKKADSNTEGSRKSKKGGEPVVTQFDLSTSGAFEKGNDRALKEPITLVNDLDTHKASSLCSSLMDSVCLSPAEPQDTLIQKDTLHLMPYSLEQDQGLIKSPLSFDTSSMFGELAGFDSGIYSDMPMPKEAFHAIENSADKKEEFVSTFSPFLEQRDWHMIVSPVLPDEISHYRADKSGEKKADYNHVSLSLPEKIIDYSANLNNCVSDDELEIKRIVNELENQLQTTKLESPTLLVRNSPKPLQMSKFSPLRLSDESENDSSSLDMSCPVEAINAPVADLPSEHYTESALPWSSPFQFELIDGHTGPHTPLPSQAVVLEPLTEKENNGLSLITTGREEEKVERGMLAETKEEALEQKRYAENLMKSLEVISDSIFKEEAIITEQKELSVTSLMSQQHQEIECQTTGAFETEDQSEKEAITRQENILSPSNINERKDEIEFILNESPSSLSERNDPAVCGIEPISSEADMPRENNSRQEAEDKVLSKDCISENSDSIKPDDCPREVTLDPFVVEEAHGSSSTEENGQLLKYTCVSPEHLSMRLEDAEAVKGIIGQCDDGPLTPALLDISVDTSDKEEDVTQILNEQSNEDTISTHIEANNNDYSQCITKDNFSNLESDMSLELITTYKPCGPILAETNEETIDQCSPFPAQPTTATDNLLILSSTESLMDTDCSKVNPFNDPLQHDTQLQFDSIQKQEILNVQDIKEQLPVDFMASQQNSPYREIEDNHCLFMHVTQPSISLLSTSNQAHITECDSEEDSQAGTSSNQPGEMKSPLDKDDNHNELLAAAEIEYSKISPPHPDLGEIIECKISKASVPSPLSITSPEVSEESDSLEKTNPMYDLKLSPLNYSSISDDPPKLHQYDYIPISPVQQSNDNADQREDIELNNNSAQIFNNKPDLTPELTSSHDPVPINEAEQLTCFSLAIPNEIISLAPKLKSHMEDESIMSESEKTSSNEVSTEDSTLLRNISDGPPTPKSICENEIQLFSEPSDKEPTIETGQGSTTHKQEMAKKAQHAQQGKVVCEICFMCFRTVPGLKRHKAMKHSLRAEKHDGIQNLVASQEGTHLIYDPIEKTHKDDSHTSLDAISETIVMSKVEETGCGLEERQNETSEIAVDETGPQTPKVKKNSKSKRSKSTEVNITAEPFSDQLLNILKTNILQAITPEFQNNALKARPKSPENQVHITEKAASELEEFIESVPDNTNISSQPVTKEAELLNQTTEYKDGKDKNVKESTEICTDKDMDNPTCVNSNLVGQCVGESVENNSDGGETLTQEICENVAMEIKSENNSDVSDNHAQPSRPPPDPPDASADLKAIFDDDNTFSQLFPRDEEVKRKKCPRVYTKRNKKQKTDPNLPTSSAEQFVKGQPEQTAAAFTDKPAAHCQYETISIDDAIMLNMCHNSALKVDALPQTESKENQEDAVEELGSGVLNGLKSTNDKASLNLSELNAKSAISSDPCSGACKTEEELIVPCPPPLPADPVEPRVTESTAESVQNVHSIDIQNINTTFQLPDIKCFDSGKEITLAPPVESADVEKKEDEKANKHQERRGRKRQEGGMKVKDKQYKCKVCFNWFLTLGELNFHKLSHNPSPPPTCYMCVQRKFSSREQLRDHLWEKHAKNKSGIWTCGMCLKEISDVWMYNEHLREHATQFARRGQTQGSMLGISGIMQETAVKNFITSIMQHRPSKGSRESSKTQKEPEKNGALEIATEESRVHKVKSSSGSSGRPSILTPLEVLHKVETPKNVEIHPNCKDPSRDCHHCGKQFPKPFKLQRHLVVHNLEKIFLCHKCPVSYQEAQDLKEHLKREHEEADELESKHTTLYTCELCADVMHVIKKSFICSACNYTFSKKEQFDRHMEKHLLGGNKIFKFRGVSRPVKASIAADNECDSPASKKRRLLSDSLPENSSDSGIASVSPLHQNSETQPSKSCVSMADDSTQTTVNEYHNDTSNNVKTEDVAEDYSELLIELEKCIHMSSGDVPKEEIEPVLSPNPDEEGDGNLIKEACDVKEENESVCIRAESKEGNEEVEEIVNAKDEELSRNVVGETEDIPPLSYAKESVTNLKLHEAVAHQLTSKISEKQREEELKPQASKTSNGETKKQIASVSVVPDNSGPIKEKVRTSDHSKSTSVTQPRVSAGPQNEDKEPPKLQKKRKDIKSSHSSQRVSSPATQENYNIEAQAKKKFRPSKSVTMQRKSDGPNDYPVLSSVHGDIGSNKMIAKCKTSNMQCKKSLLESCAPKKSDAVASLNGDYKAKKGTMGRTLHSPISKVPMNNSLNKSKAKMGVRAMDNHSYRTAESQNHLLSQLFGQKLTSFKIPLRKDTSESIN